MKQLRCHDAGFDCDYEIQAETDEEILGEAAKHVQSVHGLQVTPELVEQVKSLIHELDLKPEHATGKRLV
jgi:predicted small metal-binding protein